MSDRNWRKGECLIIIRLVFYCSKIIKGRAHFTDILFLILFVKNHMEIELIELVSYTDDF